MNITELPNQDDIPTVPTPMRPPPLTDEDDTMPVLDTLKIIAGGWEWEL